MNDPYDTIKKAALSLPGEELRRHLKAFDASSLTASSTQLLLKSIADSQLKIPIDDSWRRTLDQIQASFKPMHELISQAHLNAMNHSFESLVPQNTIAQILERNAESARRSADLFEQVTRSRAAFGPIADLNTLSSKYLSQIDIQQSKWFSMAEESAKAFRLPDFVEHSNLASAALKAALDPGISTAALERAMKVIDTPWLARGAEVESARAFSRLLEVGELIKTPRVFDEASVERLRSYVGDWRDREVPENIGEDIVARTAFYEEAGFDPSLTAVPSAAFDQEVVAAEIAVDIPEPTSFVVTAVPIPAANPEEDAAFQRTEFAQGRLLRFEVHVRRYIARVMLERFGQRWVVQRVAESIREEWKRKRDLDATADARGMNLIDYADFRDYEPIILQKNNWEDIFKRLFGRREDIAESFRRLAPIRLAAMHARPITHDDQALLYIETTRIMRALGVIK